MFGFAFNYACLNFRVDILCPEIRIGNCWVYDNFQLSWSILIMVMVAIATSSVFSFLTWLVYAKQKVSGEPFSPLHSDATDRLTELNLPKDAIAVSNQLTELNVVGVPEDGMGPEDGTAESALTETQNI